MLHGQQITGCFICNCSCTTLLSAPTTPLALESAWRQDICGFVQMQYEWANLPGACPKFPAALRRDAGDLTACRRTGPSTEVITIAPNVNTKLLGTSHELSAVRAGPSFGALLPQFPPRLCRCRRDGSIADLGRDAGLLKHVPRDEILNSVLFLPHA